MAEANAVAVVIMAGGSGTRFWPHSQPEYPKQYLSLMGDRSLIQQTADRVAPLVSAAQTYICSGESQRTLLQEQLPELARRQNFFLEPMGKNTAACLMLSLMELLRRGADAKTVMIALPADHYIRDSAKFLETLRQAIRFASESHGLVALGIVPTSPHTGYGYIEARKSGSAGESGVFPVERFVEKPDRQRAEEFLRHKNFFWNAGIFVWTLQALGEAFQAHMPEAWRKISDARSRDELIHAYQGVESTPIDVGVLEKARNLYVIPADLGWSDIGSWGALYELKATTPGANAILSGDVRQVESKGCLVKVDHGKKVALVGVENLIVVEKDGTLLIAHRDRDQAVRQIAKDFTERV